MYFPLPWFLFPIWIIVNTFMSSVCVCLHACAQGDLLKSELTLKLSERLQWINFYICTYDVQNSGAFGREGQCVPHYVTCNTSDTLQTNNKATKKNPITQRKTCSSVGRFVGNVSVKWMTGRVKQMLNCTVSGRTILISHGPVINDPFSAEAQWMWIKPNAISTIKDFSLNEDYIKLSLPLCLMQFWYILQQNHSLAIVNNTQDFALSKNDRLECIIM